MTIFERRESEVQSYARSFPVTFHRAAGCWLTDTEGNSYLDFLAGAGSLNYGHNHPTLRDALVEYIQDDGIAHGLDMHTKAKSAFLESFEKRILEPRGLDYKVMFTGPTGTNAVEAALKLARRAKGRENIISFTNGFHGVTLGALAMTGNVHHRHVAGVTLSGATPMPFDGYFGESADSTDYLDRVLSDGSSGVDLPAAVIVECVQGEGGINIPPDGVLEEAQAVCRANNVLLIFDEIQTGLARTGKMFAFQHENVQPDGITIGKALSGGFYPISAFISTSEVMDVFKPGDHGSTFGGNPMAASIACAALDVLVEDNLAAKSAELGDYFLNRLRGINSPHIKEVRGRGLFIGVELKAEAGGARRFCEALMHEGMLAKETHEHIIRFAPPLVISKDEIDWAFEKIEKVLTTM